LTEFTVSVDAPHFNSRFKCFRRVAQTSRSQEDPQPQSLTQRILAIEAELGLQNKKPTTSEVEGSLDLDLIAQRQDRDWKQVWKEKKKKKEKSSPYKTKP
jgi:hypothetical protein